MNPEVESESEKQIGAKTDSDPATERKPETKSEPRDEQVSVVERVLEDGTENAQRCAKGQDVIARLLTENAQSGAKGQDVIARLLDEHILMQSRLGDSKRVVPYVRPISTRK